MLFEFDADQQLRQDTVRDAVGKHCPPTLARSVAEDGADPTPLWKTDVEQGWTELTDPANAVELAIERARSLSYFAALTIAANDPHQQLAALIVKGSEGECQSIIFRHGLQSFGAMGFSWENDLQFALKRAKACELVLGSAAEDRASIAEEYCAAHV